MGSVTGLMSEAGSAEVNGIAEVDTWPTQDPGGAYAVASVVKAALSKARN